MRLFGLGSPKSKKPYRVKAKAPSHLGWLLPKRTLDTTWTRAESRSAARHYQSRTRDVLVYRNGDLVERRPRLTD